MILSIADTRHPNSLASKVRRKRFAFFKSLLAEIPRPLKILDVGGTDAFWNDSDFLDDAGVGVTLLNVKFAGEGSSRVERVRGDARNLEWADRSFDIVYSNSVIEHVGGAHEQRRMANEIRRVGRRYFV
ncbi:MAG: class I SAM-dependent methyltransferase, partial [Candidatus Eremiobacteraeota bacterium]|nr:class I SAM-dependent methyltransferase [Candidatus Eremiobacteraeota bacterium]